MTMKRSGLGRNLSALLSQSSSLVQEKPPQELLKLAIHCLQPGHYQPRKDIPENALQDLAESIKKQGVLQPLLVRELTNGQYEIIAGERRWRASQLAGLEEVPVILKQVDNETALALALIENLQREDLNAMDQARAMHRLTTEFSLTHQQIADLLSKSRTAVSNFLRLLSLTSEVKAFLENGQLHMGHARALLTLEPQQQDQIVQLIIAQDLSVRETEKLVERVKAGKTRETPSNAMNYLYQENIKLLAAQLQTQVKIKESLSGKGSLVIHFKNADFLKKILEQITLKNE